MKEKKMQGAADGNSEARADRNRSLRATDRPSGFVFLFLECHTCTYNFNV
jgi:hypothetical protein